MFYTVTSYYHSKFALNSLAQITKRNIISNNNIRCFAGPNPAALNPVTKEKIENLISKNKVVLFMKGNKLFPQW